MALEKEIITATGYPAWYHTISDVQISFKKRLCEVLVVGFKDAATRHQSHAQPLWGKRFQWREDNFSFSNAPDAAPLWQQLYAALKQLPEFENAADV
jgi:hypothetical protein